MNLFTFNGGYFNNPSRNTGMNFPPPDAIQEFSMLTNNFTAEYGRNPGSQVNVVSKAGTNEFHGSVWEFLRNDALNARNCSQIVFLPISRTNSALRPAGRSGGTSGFSSVRIRACAIILRLSGSGPQFLLPRTAAGTFRTSHLGLSLIPSIL